MKIEYVGATTYVMSHVDSDECTFLGISDNEEIMVSIASESPEKQFAITGCDNLRSAMDLISSIRESRGIDFYYITETKESSQEVYNRLIYADTIAFERHNDLYRKGFTPLGVKEEYKKAFEAYVVPVEKEYKEDYSGQRCWVISSTLPVQEGGLLAVLDNPEVGKSFMSDNPDMEFNMSECPNFGTAMNMCNDISGYEDDYVTFTTDPQQEDEQEGYNLMRNRDVVAWMDTTGRDLEKEGHSIAWILEEYQVVSDAKYVRESN